MEDRNKGERISGLDGKDTIHHSGPQVCGQGGHHIFHYGRTIGENTLGGGLE